MTKKHDESNGKPDGWDAAKAESEKADAARVEKSAPRVGRYDVALSPIERLALGQKIAQLDADVEKLEADKKSAVAEWNGKIEAASAELRSLCSKLRKGAEERDVRVVDVKDFGANSYRVVDAENEGVVYFERALDARERQADLFVQDVAKKAAEAAEKNVGEAAKLVEGEPEAPAKEPDASSFDAGAPAPEGDGFSPEKPAKRTRKPKAGPEAT